MAPARSGEDQPLGHRWPVRRFPRQRDLDRWERLHVGAEGVSDRSRKRDIPELAALGWGEHGLAPAQRELLNHVERVRLEVDRVDGDAENLALSEPAAGAQVGHRLEAPRHGRANSEDPFRRPRDHALGVHGRRPDRAGRTRVAGEMPVIHGRARCGAHVRVDRPGVRTPDAVLLKPPHPVADVGSLERPERARTQVREGVQPKLRLHRGLSVRVSPLRGNPAARPGVRRRPKESGTARAGWARRSKTDRVGP